MLFSSGVSAAADFDQVQALADFESGTKAYYSKDYKTAIQLLLPLAELGLSQAQQYLGSMYSHGWGVLENNKTSLKWWTLSAKQGNWHAQGVVANHYITGEGAPADLVKAYMWFNLSHYNGSPIADMHKEQISKILTDVELIKAQDMSSRCLESNYTDC